MRRWEALLALLALAYVFCGASASVFHPASNAMVADLSRGNERLRGDGFAALGVVANLGLVAAFGAMYPVLGLRLTDYAPLWAAFTALGLATVLLNACLLRETLGARGAPRVALRSGVGALWRDPLLRSFVPLSALAAMAQLSTLQLLGPYQVLVLGYGNAEASICGVVLPVLGLVTSAFASPLIRRFGAFQLLLATMLLTALGACVIGLGTASARRTDVEACFWLGMAIVAVAWNLIQPCFKTILSTRTVSSHQGSLGCGGRGAKLIGGCGRPSTLWRSDDSLTTSSAPGAVAAQGRRCPVLAPHDLMTFRF